MSGCRYCRVRAAVHFDRRTFCSNECVDRYRAELRCDAARYFGRAPAGAAADAPQSAGVTAPARAA
jgi:hypothetical protein